MRDLRSFCETQIFFGVKFLFEFEQLFAGESRSSASAFVAAAGAAEAASWASIHAGRDEGVGVVDTNFLVVIIVDVHVIVLTVVA